MSVTGTVTVGDSLYVPYRTAKRGGEDGGDPVGTLSIDGEVTGDSGSGLAVINVTSRKFEHGFHPLIVPTLVSINDDLAAAEEVRFSLINTGNERINDNIHEVQLAVRADVNVARFDRSGFIIEPDSLPGANIMSAVWQTNTDTKVYHLHVFCFMFDAELIAASGKLAGVLGGVT